MPTPFTLLVSILNKEQDIISCAKHSKLKKEYHYEGIQELLETQQKKPIIQDEYEFK